MPRTCGLLFPFYEPLQLLQTCPYDYSALAKQGPTAAQLAAAVRPDFLSELAFHRGSVSTWLQSLSSNGAASASAPPPVPDVAVEGLAALAARLHGLVLVVGTPLGTTAAAGTGAAAAAGSQPAGGGGSVAAAATAAAAAVSLAAAVTMSLVRPQWSSALSKKPQRMLRLDCLPQDLAMVYSALGAALRLSALQRCGGAGEEAPPASAAAAAAGGASEAATAAAAAAAAPQAAVAEEGGGGGRSPPSGAQVALTAAVAGLRRAAGVYEYLAEGLLPALSGAGEVGGGDRPLELLPAAARAMQLLCLAEGQALVAAAAAARGMSPGTQRALHAGCAALFRQASAAVQALGGAAPGGLPPSDRLGRLVGSAAALHTARAHLCLARERQGAMELGEAEAACEEARKLLDAAARGLDRRADPAAWMELIQAEQASCAALHSAVQRDRLAITFQPLPKQPPDAAASPAVRVAPDSFQPEPLMPPAPPAAEQGKGGCAVM
ncbi:hypothetical protein PLESTB_000573500 [Pleodorina starrii]|uniref:BRO1 domain-containing protein n=1 Tax=Pleodorina starrii TaxID=330485 RepID=A0A9W6F0T9_9CHLO|nr:hypothetical protein PLESTM_000311300 [Pleodorina starrii]GLC52019.1 hypothetical protein PLESTB_000573500 [Pleodorina starrii]GLC72158.1 hypothetical protein PLESTF_001213200 [Pleodorina starrii]